MQVVKHEFVGAPWLNHFSPKVIETLFVEFLLCVKILSNMRLRLLLRNDGKF